MGQRGARRGLCRGVSPGGSQLLVVTDPGLAAVTRLASPGESRIRAAKVYAAGAVASVGNDLPFPVRVLPS